MVKDSFTFFALQIKTKENNDDDKTKHTRTWVSSVIEKFKMCHVIMCAFLNWTQSFFAYFTFISFHISHSLAVYACLCTFAYRCLFYQRVFFCLYCFCSRSFFSRSSVLFTTLRLGIILFFFCSLLIARSLTLSQIFTSIPFLLVSHSAIHSKAINGAWKYEMRRKKTHTLIQNHWMIKQIIVALSSYRSGVVRDRRRARNFCTAVNCSSETEEFVGLCATSHNNVNKSNNKSEWTNERTNEERK